ncbi:MAG: hypothetical protein HGB32_09535 [Geobacteraceae bacterium]|nr:hypothetical protein [Geobacteraceae bacterium]NTW80375.1 hypothetical protein [Geobacteraceae bacterium]
MISHSTLSIDWLKPDIEEERWEFFNHPAKQEWYRSHAVTWEQIVSCFDCGELVSYQRSAAIGEVPVALSYHSYDDYQFYLAKAKRGYRKNYSQMEDALQSGGSLSLKAPIVLCYGGEGLLFSGYRRLCLGWNYGMIPSVWLVQLG